MEQKIKQYFANFNFDLRQTKDGRYMDQKVTPDVLTVISEAVLEYTALNGKDCKFTTKDIWNLDYLDITVKSLFGKPSLENETARHEYDKFIQQPLKALAAAKILDCQKIGRKNIFSVVNNEILEFISMKDRNALIFIIIYLEKTLKDSNLLEEFTNFFNNPNKNTYYELKQTYVNFIKQNTDIKKDFEPKRIFTKIINPLAFKYSTYGSEKGVISKNIIRYTDLMYNRKNFRDIKKNASETRAEYMGRIDLDDEITYSDVYKSYTVQKAKRFIKKIHGNISEVRDEFSNGEATQVHHIFPSNEFPEISAYLENLILLTGTQHYSMAHALNYTAYVSKEYQYICLLAKLDTVKKFVEKEDEKYYSKSGYIYVVSIGTSKELPNDMSFEEIKTYLCNVYSAS